MAQATSRLAGHRASQCPSPCQCTPNSSMVGCRQQRGTWARTFLPLRRHLRDPVPSLRIIHTAARAHLQTIGTRSLIGILLLHCRDSRREMARTQIHTLVANPMVEEALSALLYPRLVRNTAQFPTACHKGCDRRAVLTFTTITHQNLAGIWEHIQCRQSIMYQYRPSLPIWPI